MDRRTLLTLTAGVAAAPWLPAQGWPVKPLRIIVPFPPGNASDILARALAARMPEALGQPVVVENRPGAGGTIGIDAVAKATDEHTLLMGTAAHTVSAATYPSLPFDARRDFAPVTLLITTPLLLLVPAASPLRTVQDLIAAARAKPGQVTFASSGNGTSHQIAGEFLKATAGINLVHVPYRGSAPAQLDLTAGRVAMMFDNIVAGIGPIRGGRLRARAVTSAARSPILPEVPTMAEQGLPGFEVNAWFGLLAPASLPHPMTERLATIASEVVRQPEVSGRLVEDGAVVAAAGPEQFGRFLAADFARWERVAREGNIRISD